jgi:acyl-coenzyme A thioesterase PaaI-like protein
MAPVQQALRRQATGVAHRAAVVAVLDAVAQVAAVTIAAAATTVAVVVTIAVAARAVRTMAKS